MSPFEVCLKVTVYFLIVIVSVLTLASIAYAIMWNHYIAKRHKSYKRKF